VSSSAVSEVWDAIARDAVAESPLWGDALKPQAGRRDELVFSPLAEERFALGLETIYEGYLVHYGESRLFDPTDDDSALLLGDYLYAHGLVRVAGLHEVDAVADLSELISLCSQLRAEEVRSGPRRPPCSVPAGSSTSRARRSACAATRQDSTAPRAPPAATAPSSVHWLLTPAACVRLSPMLNVLAETAAEEGKKVILSMLVVGLIFLSVIAIGELTHWLRSRR
jgi:hypothetical protein